MNNPHNLYFHTPFCASKCNYCAFYSTACANPDWDGYCDGILADIDRWGDRLGNVTLPTIFFGGGTPSLMPTRIFEQIISRVKRRFSVPGDCEISLESNPGTIDGDKLRQFQSIGMNRLSVGAQSLNNEDLCFLGRRHDAAAATRLIQDAMDLGLRVSADFIYGLPGQTARDVENMCRRINDLGLGHCSMYELSIEPGTPLSKMNPAMPRNEDMADMYQAVGQTLDLPRYEVSNYAAPGQECRHNQNVWDGRPYIGIGPGAAGRPYIDGIWYEQIGANGAIKKMDPNARALEKLITGMRTIRGVALTDDVRGVIDLDFAAGHPELVKIGPDDKIMSATPKGMLILDDLLVNLVK